MRTVIATILALALTTLAHATHTPLESGKVYQIGPVVVCKSPEPMVTAHEVYKEAGPSAAQTYIKGKMREGECGLIRGAVLFTGKTFATWEVNGSIFELVEFKTPKGKLIYTTYQYEKHGKEA